MPSFYYADASFSIIFRRFFCAMLLVDFAALLIDVFAIRDTPFFAAFDTLITRAALRYAILFRLLSRHYDAMRCYAIIATMPLLPCHLFSPYAGFRRRCYACRLRLIRFCYAAAFIDMPSAMAPLRRLYFRHSHAFMPIYCFRRLLMLMSPPQMFFDTLCFTRQRDVDNAARRLRRRLQYYITLLL